MDVQQYLIIDDTESDALYLKKMLDKFPALDPVGIAHTLESALKIIDSQPVDLVFLDIKLDGQLGLSLLKTGMALPPVIITSAYPDYALESYEIGKAADYLLKPYTSERLHIALDRALQGKGQLVSARANTIFLKMGRKVQRFDIHAIDYVEAFGIYSKVYANNQMYLVNERFAAIADLLSPHLFRRIHKSYLIQVNKITGYDRNHIWLDQIKVPIGRSYRPALEEVLSLFDTSEEEPE